jgi:hypothetical protein
MGYASTINSAVRLAFDSVKDLAENVTLNKKNSNTFDFGSSTTAASSSTQTIIKAVVVSDKKGSREGNTIKKQLLFKSEDLADITLYDSVVISGQLWSFGQAQNDNGYVTILDVYRGV